MTIIEIDSSSISLRPALKTGQVYNKELKEAVHKITSIIANCNLLFFSDSTLASKYNWSDIYLSDTFDQSL